MDDLKYFKPSEFIMHSQNVYDKMSMWFLKKLDKLRHEFGLPMVLNSSYRTPTYNQVIGGKPKSMHLKGRAVDIDATRYTGAQRAKLVKLALDMGFSVGVSSDMIHLDDRENQVLFGY